ncbi:hypothetical protein D3C79_522430 [compost metagenome]
MRASLFTAAPSALAATFSQAQTLPDAMQKALEVHPQIQDGVNARVAAHYPLRPAEGGYFAGVDVTADYGRGSTDSPSTANCAALSRGESANRLRQIFFDGFAISTERGRQQATANGVECRSLLRSADIASAQSNTKLRSLRSILVSMQNSDGRPITISTAQSVTKTNGRLCCE